MVSRTPLLLGWSHTQFGKRPEATLESLVVEAGRAALADAAVDPRQVDLVVVGHFNSGMHPLGFPSSLPLQIDDGLFGVPSLRVENACASGSAAVHTALTHLLAGRATTILVIGVEKMTGIPPEAVGSALLGADYDAAGTSSTSGFAGLFADVAREYERRHGPVADTLGAIAAKSHRLGAANPLAHLRKDLGEEFCSTTSERNPVVAAPLRRTDCSPVSDGAAALVLGHRPTSERHGAVRVVGWAAANDHLPSSRRDPLAFAATELAWHRALADADVSTTDLDLVELHDCFTIAELRMYEVLGLAGPGEGRRALEEGLVLPGGVLPVNPSGGLKSKGHPVGATGVSQHVCVAMQLTGTFPGHQVAGARLGAVHNMGGLAVANHVTVLAAP
ncbi:thiolase domain-containing protein [Nocardioides sp. SYSU D00038]|uniref:thiolase domain-containing protein n=1 Tax=Nocardioides sp. SYSU D00038 TaxID=2812554 RepID=UPI0019675642|nr:thiolase domain-containing protein [Nocardioides sp. SYSU D00038]